MCPLLSQVPLSRRIIRPGLPRGFGRPKGDDRSPINYPRQTPPGLIAEQFPELVRGHLYVAGTVGFDAKVSRFSEAVKSFIRFSEPTELQPVAAVGRRRQLLLTLHRTDGKNIAPNFRPRLEQKF